MRYPHYLYRVGAGKWPSLVVAVDCKARSLRSPSPNKGQRGQLQEWSLLAYRLKNQCYYKDAEAKGQSATGFWHCLQQVSEKYQCATILSYNCHKVWSLLEFWERLEDEAITLFGEDEGRQQATDGAVPCMFVPDSRARRVYAAGQMYQLRDQRGGYIVLAQGIAIAAFVFRAGQTLLKWLDMKNFGVTEASMPRLHTHRTSWAINWWQEMHTGARIRKLGAICNTAASWAFRAFKHSYMKDAIYVSNNPAALVLEEGGYYGGRCEAFRLGVMEGTTYHYDFRSMYPAVCADCLLPIRLRRFWRSKGDEILPGDSLPDCCIARVAISTDEPAYPVKWGGEVIYQTGQFVTTLAGPELADAWLFRRIKRVYEVAQYEMAPTLREYARELYHWRCVADLNCSVAVQQTIKRMLVALPGKLAGHRYGWVDCPNVEAPCPYGYWWASDEQGLPVRMRSIAWHVQMEQNEGWSDEATPAMAAFITSNARLRLLTAIRIAGYGNVHYIDTDSLMVNVKGFVNLIAQGMIGNRELGKLDLKSMSDSVEIMGIKHYLEEGKLVCAGLPLSAPERSNGNHVITEETQPQKQIRDGQRPYYETTERKYKRVLGYHHGEVKPDGRVTPIILKEW